MTKTLYCPSCGEQVQAFEMFVRGIKVRHCPQCGTQIKLRPPTTPLPPLEVVLIAQDSMPLSEMLKKLLEDQGISRSGILCKDGHQIISQCTERFKNKERVDLIILDLQMQVLDGKETARSIRLLEQSFLREKKAPLLFFSSIRCDDTVKEFLTEVKPAAFLYKSNDTSPSAISARIKEVISRLFGEGKSIPK